MGKVIVVASGKGGTGKTTTVAALSSCLAVLGHKTLCIDFDSGMRNLDYALSMTDFTVMDYMDVISGRMDLDTACSEAPRIPNLSFLSAPAECSEDEVDVDKFIKMFDDIREKYDYCLVDAPPGIGSGFKLAHCNADITVIVTTGDFPSIRDAARAASIARELGVTKMRLLVNKVIPSNFKLIRTTVDDVIDTTGVRLLGLIPDDKYIFRALHDGVPLIMYKKRKSAYNFLDCARRLAGEEVPLYQF